MNKLKKMKTLAKIMMAASVIVILFGLYLTVRGAMDIAGLIREGNAVRASVAPVVTEIAEGLVLVVHYFFVVRFFRKTLEEGVPFTHDGAKEVKILGLEVIFLPVIAWIIGCIAYGSLAATEKLLEIAIYEMVPGFAFIIVSYIMEYGTMKIERGHRGHQAVRYIKEHYPEVLEETKAALIKDGTVTEEHLTYADKWYE